LRHRGVKGSDVEIDSVLEYFGTHALTVDVLGGVITNYLDGDARRFRELTEETQPLTRFAVGQTTAKLAHVIAAYEGYLERSEPEVRETLQRVAILPRPPSIETLTVWMGSPTARTNLALRDHLRRLVSLRQEVWVIHPAISEIVMRLLGDRRQVLVGRAREALEISLERRPRFDLRDQNTLDLVEDLISLSLGEGRLLPAVELYRNRLGGYPKLGWQWAEYARGERICRRLLDAGRAARSLSIADDYLLCADLALNLENLGRLQEALAYFRQTLDYEPVRAAHPELHFRLHNVAQACFLAGELPEASAVADRTLAMATQTGDREEELDGYSWRGLIALERGKIVEAVEQFVRCRAVQNGIQKDKRILYSTRGFGFQRALLACSRPAQALAQADASREIHESQAWQDSIARSQLAAAEALRQLRDLDAARARLAEVRKWASRANHHELLLGARLCASRVSLDEGDLIAARREAEDGMLLADMCGFGLFAIDFRNALAVSSVMEGDHANASNLATAALEMARRVRCDYFWGQLDAHRVLGAAMKGLRRTDAETDHAQRVTKLEADIQLSDDLLVPLL
jgi:tetratricopeptide (TPR) repeat protein